MTLKIASSASICSTSATSRSLLVGLPMCTNGEAIYRTIVAVVLTMLALAFPLAQAGFSQAIGTAPLLTPPVPRVLPPPTPDVLPPLTRPQAPREAVSPGPPLRIDEVRLEGITVYDPA